MFDPQPHGDGGVGEEAPGRRSPAGGGILVLREHPYGDRGWLGGPLQRF